MENSSFSNIFDKYSFVNFIKIPDLYDHHPNELADKYKVNGSEMYFLTPKDQTCAGDVEQIIRAAGNGFWKNIGVDKAIENEVCPFKFGKTFVFYEGPPRRSKRTPWIMYEYTIDQGTTTPDGMRLDDWILCKIAKSCAEPKKIAQRSQTEWSPPKDGTLKFNVDAAVCRKTRQAGIGGVLRDSKGLILCSFSDSVGICDINVAEIFAILQSLRIFLTLDFAGKYSLTVESDSLNAVSWITGRSKKPYRLCEKWNLLAAFQEINLLSSVIGDVKFLHTLREGNKTADFFAKKGLPDYALHMIDRAVWCQHSWDDSRLCNDAMISVC